MTIPYFASIDPVTKLPSAAVQAAWSGVSAIAAKVSKADPAEKIIYVSTKATASDANSGLDWGAPKATIAAAIAALAVGGDLGGVVQLGPGVHTITSTLTIPSYTTLRGVGRTAWPAGPNPTTIDASAVPSGAAITMDDASEVTISDLFLSGQSSGTASVIQTTGNCRGLTLERLTILLKNTGSGIFLGTTGSVIRSTVQSVWVTGYGYLGGANGAGSYGFRVGAACTSVTLLNNYAHYCGISGYIIQGTYIGLYACASDSNTQHGYLIQNAVGVHLSACGAESNQRTGFYLTNATGTTLSSCRSHLNNEGGLAAVMSMLSVNNASDYVTVIGCVDTSPNAATVNSMGFDTGTPGANVTLINNKVTLPVKAGLVSRVPTGASQTAGAGLNLPHGTAPTAPVNGDMWTTTAGLYVRINGTTVGPLS